MTGTQHDISVLNGLIATTIDSIDGYTEAAKDSEAGAYSSIFTNRAAERREVATLLQRQVSALGGNPEDDGTVLAGAHRVFLNLKSSVTGKDEQSIVDEVERGEDHIKSKYESALADNDVSPTTRAIIQEAYTSVRRGHDEMRNLKHSLHAG